jgi:hypothetical protein
MVRTLIRSSGADEAILLMLAMTLGVAGCGDVPVVARGKFVELATDREEPVCAGTIPRIDAYLEAVATLLGEELPNRRFLRIEWRDIGYGDSETMDHVLQDDVIVTGNPFDQHELVHAVHVQVWPRSHRLLEEGLATMIGTRGWLMADPWPEGRSIDSALGQWEGDYPAALFIVSQIIKDHGVEGLRTLWHELSPDSDAAAVRAAYQREFERSIDVLVEPVMVGPLPNRRFSCFYEICLEDAERLDAIGEWSAQGPGSCAEDGRAVGPLPREGRLSAWTHQVVEIGAEPPVIATSGGEGIIVRYCELGCNTVAHDAKVAPDTTVDFALTPGRYLVEIGHELSALPTSTPATVRFSQGQ